MVLEGRQPPRRLLTRSICRQLPLVQHLRSLIQQAAPGLREEIRWGMLSYEDSGALFALAAQKHEGRRQTLASSSSFLLSRWCLPVASCFWSSRFDPSPCAAA